MGGSYVGNAATFLIETVFGLYILLVMLRFLLQWARADFYNPVSQFIVKATQLPLKPLRKIIPGIGGLDMAALVFMIMLKFVELWLVTGVMGMSPQIGGLVVLSIADLLGLLINVFIFSILIQVIISWVNPGMYNPVMGLLHSLTEPLLGPARRVIPPISGLDLSPIVVIIVLQLASMLAVAPIRDLARPMLM
ncbi:MAG: YggT family protein [Gammaproteobacteria bacterium]|nr:YggT family protein [Gammaproteobacteria bacterium]MDX2458980.1 YggT family protein [Gammaproteobacteria bacterium]